MARFRLAIVTVFLFPLIGPATVACTVALPLAIAGLLFLGPGGLLYYLFLGGWWAPALYRLLAPPFFCAGVLIAIAELIVKRLSALAALLAAEIAFAAYFAYWNRLGGIDASADYANVSSSFFQTPLLSVLIVLIATAACWCVIGALRTTLSEAVADLRPVWPPSLRWGALLMIAAVAAGGVALAAVFAASSRVPATAWKDCTQGGWEDRMRGCTAIIEDAPDEAVEKRVTAYVRRGLAYEELRHDLVRAIADYSEAIRLDPALAEAYGRRGLAYARLGRNEEAVSDLDQALSLDPEVLRPYTYQVYRARGLANFRRREFNRAITDHSEEIRRTPHYADGYLNRGRAYFANGEVEPAIADFSQAIRVEPFRPDGYIERGSVYLAQRDADRALADFDEAIRRRPDDKLTAAAYRKRGEILESRGDLAAAFAAFETTLRLDPSDKEALAGRDRVRAALARQRAPP